jgi:hypothetical protein
MMSTTNIIKEKIVTTSKVDMNPSLNSHADSDIFLSCHVHPTAIAHLKKKIPIENLDVANEAWAGIMNSECAPHVQTQNEFRGAVGNVSIIVYSSASHSQSILISNTHTICILIVSKKTD